MQHPGDLHRIDASRLPDDRTVTVGGDIEQRAPSRPSPDEEAISDAWFSLRVFVLFALWVLALLLAVGMAVPLVLTLVRLGFAP